jgi:hypothetical protein
MKGEKIMDEYIVVEKKSGRIPYDKVYSGKGHAERVLKSNRNTFPSDDLTIIRLDSETVKKLIEEQRR